MRINNARRWWNRRARRLLVLGLLATLTLDARVDAQQPRLGPFESDPLADAAEAGVPAGPFFEPSVRFNEVYDDNVFLTAEDPKSDYVMRLTPSITAGYRSQRAVFTGSYSLDAERYRTNKVLESLTARQEVSVDFSTFGTQRFLFSATGGYIDTTTPSELNLLSGIVTGRARAERFAVRPSFTYRTSPNGRLLGAYSTAYDRLEAGLSADPLDDGLSTFTQVATVEYRHHITSRTYLSTDYAIRDFHFENRPLRPSHVIAFGVGHALSPSTTIVVRAGPRLHEDVIGPGVAVPLAPSGTPAPNTPPPSGVAPFEGETVIERSVLPEWSASLQKEMPRGTLDLSFQRTQSTAIGIETVIDTMSVTADLLFRPAAPVEVRFAPGFFRDTLGSIDTRAYRMLFGFTVWMGKHFALVSEYRHGHQEGAPAFSLGNPLQTIRQNVFTVGLLATARRRPAPPEPTTTQPQERR